MGNRFPTSSAAVAPIIARMQRDRDRGSMADKTIQAAHFIGIGGVGMSGIARVAHDQGIRVTGSDMKESRYTKQLKEAGVTVHIGPHGAANIPDGDDAPDVVVVTRVLSAKIPFAGS